MAGNEDGQGEAFVSPQSAHYSTLGIRLRSYLSTNDNDILDILIGSA